VQIYEIAAIMHASDMRGRRGAGLVAFYLNTLQPNGFQSTMPGQNG
jgi:hypothetical protein